MKNTNIGHRNTGHRNTGDFNTGDFNTGNFNTGDFNTGDCNTGDCNTGDFNTGHRNTGNFNTGHRNTGECNTTTPTVRLFNMDSGLEFNGDVHKRFKSIIFNMSTPLCEWISASNMTDQEKEENPSYETTQGYLKVNDISKNCNEISKEDEEFLRSLPNFDEAILLECTRIDLTNKKVKIMIDGKEILISKEEFESIKSQFCKDM